MNPIKYKPKKKGESDFYSWQLYKWLKKYPKSRIYSGVWNPVTGYDPNRRTLYVGEFYDGSFHGRQLNRLCVSGRGLQSFCYCGHGHHLDEWRDVTEEFFQRYKEIGVCAIHGDFAHKWIKNDPDRRTCEYCGKVEARKIVFIPKEVWIESSRLITGEEEGDD